MKTNKPRVIRVKHPQLRRFRAALRLMLRTAYSDQHIRIMGQISDILNSASLSSSEKDQKVKELNAKVEPLNIAYDEAPLGCSVCGTQAIEDDLKYNPYSRIWFCEICYSENQEYYKKNPHPWLPCWKIIYP